MEFFVGVFDTNVTDLILFLPIYDMDASKLDAVALNGNGLGRLVGNGGTW